MKKQRELMGLLMVLALCICIFSGVGNRNAFAATRDEVQKGFDADVQKALASYDKNDTSQWHVKDYLNKYSDEALVAAQRKAYELLLAAAKQCNSTSKTLSSDRFEDKFNGLGYYYVTGTPTITYRQFYDAFHDEPAFIKAFALYENESNSPVLRKKLISELYEAVYYLAGENAFWSTKMYDAAADGSSVTPKFYAPAVYKTVNAGGKTKVDYSGYKSIAVMATEFDNKIHEIINQTYHEDLSLIANEYSVFLYLSNYLTYDSDDSKNPRNGLGYGYNYYPDSIYTVADKVNSNMNALANYIYTAAMTGYGVCRGHARLASALFMYIGLRSEVVRTEASGHAWNTVYLDGEQYLVDVGVREPYPHFNLGREFVKRNYNTDPNVYVQYGTQKNINLGTKYETSFVGMTGLPKDTTVQDGEYVYFVNFCDGCNIYRERADGSGGFELVSQTKTGKKKYNIALDDIKKYLLGIAQGATLDAWKAAWSKVSKTSYHNDDVEWNYRLSAGKYYCHLALEDGRIWYYIKYIGEDSNTGIYRYSSHDHVCVANYSGNVRSNDGSVVFGIYGNTSGYIADGTVKGYAYSTKSGDSIARIVAILDGKQFDIRERYEDTSKPGKKDGFTFTFPVTDKLSCTVGSNLTIRAYTTSGLYAEQKFTVTYPFTKYKTICGLTSVKADGKGNITLSMTVKDPQTNTSKNTTCTWKDDVLGYRNGALTATGTFDINDQFFLTYTDGSTVKYHAFGWDASAASPIWDMRNIHRLNSAVFIYDWQDWNNIASLVNEGHLTNARINIEKKISCNGNTLIPIGNEANPFTGTFYGKYPIDGGVIKNSQMYTGLIGHAKNAYIYGLYGSNLKISGADHTGIIGCARSCTIKGIKVDGCYIQGGRYMGAIGYSNASTVQDVLVNSRQTISGSQYIGGIIGYMLNGSLKNSICLADVKGNSNVGNITGYASGATIN